MDNTGEVKVKQIGILCHGDSAHTLEDPSFGALTNVESQPVELSRSIPLLRLIVDLKIAARESTVLMEMLPRIDTSHMSISNASITSIGPDDSSWASPCKCVFREQH